MIAPFTSATKAASGGRPCRWQLLSRVIAVALEANSFDDKSPRRFSICLAWKRGKGCRQQLRSFPRNKFLSANRFLRENHL